MIYQFSLSLCGAISDEEGGTVSENANQFLPLSPVIYEYDQLITVTEDGKNRRNNNAKLREGDLPEGQRNIITRVWSDAANDGCTYRAVHSSIEKFFATKEPHI